MDLKVWHLLSCLVDFLSISMDGMLPSLRLPPCDDGHSISCACFMLFIKPIFMHNKAHKLRHYSNMEHTLGSHLGLPHFGRAQVLGLYVPPNIWTQKWALNSFHFLLQVMCLNFNMWTTYYVSYKNIQDNKIRLFFPHGLGFQMVLQWQIGWNLTKWEPSCLM